MQQDIRDKTKFIFFKILNQCAKDGSRSDRAKLRYVFHSPDQDRRKNQGSLKLPPSSKSSHN